MESRGPARYKHPFDLALLESQLGFIVSLSYSNPSLHLLTSSQFSLSVKSHQPCFISSPEWQVLFPPDPVFPYHNSQPRSLTLRTQRWNVLAALPELFIEFSDLTETNHSIQPSSCTPSCQLSPSSPQVFSSNAERLDHLILRTQSLFQAIKTWVETETEILCPDAYPDVVAAVLDCNASMSLLTLSKMLTALERISSRYSPASEDSSPNWMLCQRPWIEDPAMIDYWRQRAIVAYEHVRKGSTIACKVLEFGMEQLRLLGDKSGEGETDCEFLNPALGGLTPEHV
jgi:hypothetical protein